MAAIEIEQGSELDVGILGSDVDVIAYKLTGILPASKAAVIAEIPGSYGDPSPYQANAVLVRKRYAGFYCKETDQTWSAFGFAIYRGNIGFGGGYRAVSGYARHTIDLRLPIYQRQTTYDDQNQPATKYFLTLGHFERPMSEKVAVKVVDELNADILTEKIDPLVGAICRFIKNGQPYRFIGADINFTPGAPKLVEYRFQSTSPVPAFEAGSQWANDIDIPALPALGQYSYKEPGGGAAPVVGVIDLATTLEEFDPVAVLPGF